MVTLGIERNEIFIVVCEDRHTDDVITVHATRAGADERVEEFMAEYDADRYTWTEETYGAPEWVRYVGTDCEDGPNARIELGELEP